MCREIIEDVRANGTSALERIQTSGSVAAYELALVLRWDPVISGVITVISVEYYCSILEECNALLARCEVCAVRFIRV